MSPYASLFGPRRMKANPSESEAIRDPLGRDSYLWDQEEEEPDLNGKLEAARADWRNDASLNSLFGANGAFKLEDTVGKSGKNRPGDVFKVQSLLHREGLLDADKTDGPTGFLGIYDHEAIEKFQKENGLKQDGWMGPGGESIKTFEKIYQPASIRPQPQQKPQLGWKDYSLNLFDPKTWAIWDRMDERERAFYAQQAAPQGQQENTLPATKARNTQNREQPIQTPSTSKAWLEKQEADRRFEDAHKMTRKIEGGYSNRAEDRGGETNFGITASTLNDFHRLYKDSDIPKSVEQLQPNQAEYILRRMYYDWNRVGEISDPSLARHIYDMSVNPNPQKAARWVQQGINELNGNDALKVDGRLGPITLNALNRLNENQIKTLNHNLSQTREKFYRALAEQDSSQNANLNGWVARAQAYR